MQTLERAIFSQQKFDFRFVVLVRKGTPAPLFKCELGDGSGKFGIRNQTK